MSTEPKAVDHRYEVTFSGTWSVEVEATSPEEAELIAMEESADRSDTFESWLDDIVDLGPADEGDDAEAHP